MFENYPVEEASREGARAVSVTDTKVIEWTHYPLTLQAAFQRTLTMHVSYSRRRFDGATIPDRMLGHLQTLLEGIAEGPERGVCDLPLLGAEERRLLVVGWNEPGACYPPRACLHELFEAQADTTPDALAVTFEGQSLDVPRARRAGEPRGARASRAAASARRSWWACAMERSVELIVALLGILKAGGAYLPLDPSYPCGSPRVHDRGREASPWCVADRSLRRELARRQAWTSSPRRPRRGALDARAARRDAGRPSPT